MRLGEFPEITWCMSDRVRIPACLQSRAVLLPKQVVLPPGSPGQGKRLPILQASPHHEKAPCGLTLVPLVMNLDGLHRLLGAARDLNLLLNSLSLREGARAMKRTPPKKKHHARYVTDQQYFPICGTQH